jgi:VWFA-related protein
MRAALFVAVAAASVVASSPPVSPASPPVSSPPRQQVFQTGVELVGLDVSVSRNGKPIQGLTARDFIVLDNGVAQDLESATLETGAPLDVQLVLDTSGSVAGDRLTHLVAAGTGLVHALHADDRVGLITFSTGVGVRSRMTTDFGAVILTLRSLAAANETALRDAVELGLSLGRGSSTSRPLMIVFSDGVDNASWLSDEEVLDTARKAGIVTHVVVVPGDDGSPATFLDQLTKATGGRSWAATSNRDLERLFTTALDEMRARYLLTFTPKGPRKEGWHELKVRLASGRGDIVARPGYFARGPG